MRISDWSSDVCSSDLLGDDVGAVPVAALADRVDRVARRADQLADGTVRHFGMVLQNPGDAVGLVLALADRGVARSEEHTSELQSLMRISYAVFCLKKKNITPRSDTHTSKTANNNKQ